MTPTLSWDERRLQASARRVGNRTDPYAAVANAGLERRDLFGKRRGRSPALGQILIAVPRTGHAAIYDPALAEGAVLMAADVRNGRNLAVKQKDGDAFAVQKYHGRALLGNGVERAGIHETVPGGRRAFLVETPLLA